MALTNLADVLRSAGLDVVEIPGWKVRWRGGGDYLPGRPTAVMVHHTASSATEAADVNYMTFWSPIAPIANLYVGRSGRVHVMAGGPTNTNGRGGPLDGVPKDSMNTHAIGVEIGNNGVGEPYPAEQQDAVLAVVAALCRTYMIPWSKVFAHFEWAPTRKIDPAGPSRWSSGGPWDMDEFRADVAAVLFPPASPPIIPPEVDMIECVTLGTGHPNYLTNGVIKTHVRGKEAMKFVRKRLGIDGARVVSQAELNSYGPIVGPMPEGVDPWGQPT